MRKVFLAAPLILLMAGIFGFRNDAQDIYSSPATSNGEEIDWMSWEEAMEASEKDPKKLFIDLYTDWCGWCKKMDKTTFRDQRIVKLINENFYPVKLDAERRKPIEYQGQTLEYVASGRRGVHELAYSLLDGNLGYPAYVYLNEQQQRITISKGYKGADAMLKELRYIGQDHYKDTSWKDFATKQ